MSRRPQAPRSRIVNRFSTDEVLANWEAIKRVARSEGIFLDQVYTGKTMAGMIDLLAKGDLAAGLTIVFWHTGGTPGLFGHAEDFREPQS